MSLGRPTSDEYPPFAAQYVNGVPGDDPISVLSDQIAKTTKMLASFGEAGSSFRYAAGKWSVKEMVVHISDTERILSTRLLRIARGDSSPLPSFDQDLYVVNSNADNRTLANIVQEFQSVRAASIALLSSLRAEAWSRRGTASNAPCTPRGLAFLLAGHELHHVRILEQHYLTGLAAKA
jgi:hypothetical protein